MPAIATDANEEGLAAARARLLQSGILRIQFDALPAKPGQRSRYRVKTKRTSAPWSSCSRSKRKAALPAAYRQRRPNLTLFEHLWDIGQPDTTPRALERRDVGRQFPFTPENRLWRLVRSCLCRIETDCISWTD